MSIIKGFHHLTACVSGAQEDVDFYVKLLGQSLVKKTVLLDGEDPIYHLYWNFLSLSTATNGARYNNPQVDEIIMSALYEVDAAKREALSKQAQQIIVDEAPWVFLYKKNDVVASRSNIKSVNWNADEAPRYWIVTKE